MKLSKDRLAVAGTETRASGGSMNRPPNSWRPRAGRQKNARQ